MQHDVIVIGGGHAGCEAAAACGAARARAPAADPPDRDDRRDVVQPGDRRPGQGPSGARDRRARRRHGARHRPRRHPVPHAQPQQGPGGARPARPGRPQALPRRHAGAARGQSGPRRSARPRSRIWRSMPRAGSPASSPRTGETIRGGRGGADHRHVPARPHPYRRGAPAGGAGRGGAVDRPGGDPGAARLRAGPAEDRDAAAARRPHHRLGRPGGAARRRPAAAVFVPDAAHHDAARCRATSPRPRRRPMR